MVNNKIKGIFKEVFDADLIDLNTSIGDLENWDSFGHIELVVTLEKTFDIKLTFAEITQLKSVGKIQEFLVEKGVIRCANSTSKSSRLSEAPLRPVMSTMTRSGATRSFTKISKG
jgi:acyl carrier protein